RPHILKADISTSPDVIDPITGGKTEGGSRAVEYGCRATPNGAGKEISTTDGSRVVYGYLIHADIGDDIIPFGTEIKVFEGGNIIAKGKVLRFWTNQMNTRIWI